MNVLAVATTTADKLAQIPLEFWLKLALAVLTLVAAILILRKVVHVNKVVLTVVGVFLATVVGFNWIYERNEPSWATPVVSLVSGFFPTKAKIAAPAKPQPPVAAKKR